MADDQVISQKEVSKLLEASRKRPLYDAEINALNRAMAGKWLVHRKDGTFFGWKFSLSQHPDLRDATDDEVAEYFGEEGPPDFSTAARSKRRAKVRKAARAASGAKQDVVIGG